MGFMEFHGGSEDMDGMDMGDDGMSGGDTSGHSSMAGMSMKMYLHFTKGSVPLLYYTNLLTTCEQATPYSSRASCLPQQEPSSAVV